MPGSTASMPPEGLVVEPIAVRAPSGHTTGYGVEEVELKTDLLSHKLTAGAITMMPSCFHEALRENLMSIFENGLVPGGGSGRLVTFFNALAPWDQRSYKLAKGTKTSKIRGERAVFYIPSETLMDQFQGRITDSGQPVTDQVIPFGSLRGAWVQDSDRKWHRLIVLGQSNSSGRSIDHGDMPDVTKYCVKRVKPLRSAILSLHSKAKRSNSAERKKRTTTLSYSELHH